MPPTKKRKVNYCCVPGRGKKRRSFPNPRVETQTETLRYEISNFKTEIAAQRDKEWLIELPTLEAHGYKWSVAACPNPHTGKINFALYLEDEGVLVNFRSTVQVFKENKDVSILFKQQKLRPDTIQDNEPVVICSNLEVMDTFTLEVDIQFLGLKKQVWFPENTPRDETVAKLFGCKETSDVTFVVEGHEFDLHKNILFVKCKRLYEIANERDAQSIPIIIESMKRLVFENLVEYIYTQKIHSVSLQEAKELLVAADRFECIDLKLYMESMMTFYDLKAENAAELLIFAKSYSCALLWEAATREYIRDAETVKHSEYWPRILESNQILADLLEDVMPFSKRGMERIYDKDNKRWIETMDVADLRNELQEADLALDGSRRVLVKRLETYREKDQRLQRSGGK